MKFPRTGAVVKILWVYKLLSYCEFACSLESQLELEESIIETDDIGTDDFCMLEYPYTFSKCLQICSPHMNPTCLGDSLCVCQSSQDNPQSRNATLDPKTTCVKTNYCDVSCRELRVSPSSVSGQFFQEGHLCSSSSYSACVCFSP